MELAAGIVLPRVEQQKLKGLSADEILLYYRTVKEDVFGGVGYSESTLKDAIVGAVRRLPGSRIVDLGSGPNPVILFDLYQANPKLSLTAVDLSEGFCDHALRNAEARDVPLAVVNESVHKTGLSAAAFDIAILSETLEHVPDEIERATLVEVHRLLAPGGYLVISVPNRDDLFERYMTWRRGYAVAHPQHLREYTLGGLRRLVSEAGFTVRRRLAISPPPSSSKVGNLLAALPVPARWTIKAALVAQRS